MTLETYEWNAIISMFKTARDSKMAKLLFEMWLDEKYSEVYQKAWKDCCEEYNIEDKYCDKEY